jgi:hypothetical protein
VPKVTLGYAAVKLTCHASQRGYKREEPASETDIDGSVLVKVVPPVVVVPTVEVAEVQTEDTVLVVDELEVVVEVTGDDVDVVGVVDDDVDVDVGVVVVVDECAANATYAPTPAITTITMTITAIATVLIARIPSLSKRSCFFK